MTSPAPTDRDQSLEFCKKFINNPKDELYLPELIATLPIYEKIAYDTVLEKPVIRSSKSKTWHELKDDTIAPIRDALKKRLKAYGRDLRNEEEFDEAEKVDDAILRIERFDKILLSALPSIVKPGETKKRTSCIKFLQGSLELPAPRPGAGHAPVPPHDGEGCAHFAHARCSRCGAARAPKK